LAATVTDASGLTGSADAEVIVDTRVPGVLTAPEAGSTLAGRPRFEVTPTEGFDGLMQVGLYLQSSPSASFSIFNASPDGVWRTTYPMGGLSKGPATLRTWMYWKDQFNQQHSYSPAPIEVAIDPVAIPLEATLEPTEGTAPLSTTLNVATSDPNGLALSVSVNWGDGTQEQVAVTSPYDLIALEHEFVEPGTYNVFVSVSNGEGGYASRTIPLSVGGAPNEAPTLDMTVTPTTGAAPLDVAVGLDATDPDGDDLTYRVDFGDGSVPVSGPLDSDPVTYTYSKVGTYLVRASVSDGRLTAVVTKRVDVVLPEPLTANAGDDQIAVSGDELTFSGAASRPSALIESYSWDFGDGTRGSGLQAKHVYQDPGTYRVALTVAVGNATQTDTAIVTVQPVPRTPGLHVDVDADGSALAGAEVMVVNPDGSRISALTGTDGQAVLNGLPDGDVTVYVWASGFKPAAVQAAVMDGSGEVGVVLSSGEIGATTLDHRRLTLAEIEARGIDTSDPANQNVYEGEINLFFVPECPPDQQCQPEQESENLLLITYNGEGEIIAVVSALPDVPGPAGCDVTDPVAGCFLLGGYRFYPSVQYVESQPILQWLVIPVKASWLKEFFDVTMIVQNLTEGFTFTEGVAALEIPGGLSLAPTSDAQSAVVDVPDISGGGSRSVAWTLRGDMEGEYALAAAYSGVVEPLGKPVRLEARSTTPLKVWGGSAVKMVVEADEHAVRWAPYAIDVSLENLTDDVPIYNASVELKDRPEDAPDWQAPYVFAPLTEMVQSTAVIPPGGRFTGRWIVYPGLGNDEVRFLELVEEMSFVRRTGGNVDIATEVRSRPNDPSISQQLDVDVVVEKDGDDRILADWSAPEVDGKQVAGYQVFTKQTLDSRTSWQPYDSRATTTEASNLEIPAANRGKGRYLGILTWFTDGSSMMAHGLGEGPARYVSLGDSFSSGEGVPEFESGTATGDNDCHRSFGSYARLLANRGGALDGLQPAAFHACSGAVTRDIETSNPKHAGESAQRDHVNEFTDLITLSMGGNDIAFGDIAMACVLGDCSWAVGKELLSEAWELKQKAETALACAAAAETGAPPAVLKCAYGLLSEAQKLTADGERKVSTLYLGSDGKVIRERLTRVYSALAQDAPNARIVILKYPRLVQYDNTQHDQFCGITPFSSEDLGTLGLSGSEQVTINFAVDQLNLAIDDAASRAQEWARSNGSSATFETVDPNPVFAGSELCKGGELRAPSAFNALVNPVLSAPGAYGPWAYSYHPNADGQELFAEAMSGRLAGLSTQVTLRPGDVVEAGTLDVTASADSVVVSEQHPGSQIGLHLIGPNGQRYGEGSAGVRLTRDATTATLVLEDPQPGTWAVEVEGVDVADQGEETQVRAWASPAPVEPLNVVASTVQTDASEYEFDVDLPQFSEAQATWLFSDGQTATGAHVVHDFGATPKPWHAFVTVTTPDGRSGSASVTAEDAPVPPAARNVSAAMEGETATIRWEAGEDNGVDPVGYVVSTEPGGATCATTSGLMCAIDGLDPDVEYQFTVITLGPAGSVSMSEPRSILDATPPSVSASITGTEGSDGWYTSDVEVSWVLEDLQSRITSTVGCEPTTLSDDTPGLDIECLATSAGGTTRESLTVKRDATPPRLAGTATEPSGDSGWYKSDVTIAWTCADDLSGVPEDDCPGDAVIAGEGASLFAIASVSDRAGNRTQADSAVVKIDRTPPTTTAIAPHGWSGADVTVELNATDTLSGVASTSWSLDGSAPEQGGSVTIVGDGRHELTFFSTDKAGNVEEPITIEVRLDASGPIVTHQVNPEPNAAGWHREPVTVSFECSDPVSGVGTCPEDQVVAQEGAGQVVSGEAVDAAGNGTVDHVLVNLDLTDPEISAVVGGQPNSAGWFQQPVSVAWTCTDALSGVSDCPESVMLTEASPGPVVGRATDVAGNTATATVGPLKIDVTAPAVEITGVTDGDRYVLGSVPSPGCSASDAGSGLTGDCAVTISGGTQAGVGDFAATAVARDKAGNSTSVTTRYRVVYPWSGFLPPISTDSISSFKAGSQVTVGFVLTDAKGQRVQPGSPPQWLTPQKGPAIGSPLSGVVASEPQTSGKTFTLSKGTWQYKWKTNARDRGYYWRIGVRLDDGEVHQVWVALR
jgi:PKD repeat protein